MCAWTVSDNCSKLNPSKSLDCFKENEIIVTYIIITHMERLLVRLGMSLYASDLSGFPDQLPQTVNCDA